MLFNCENKDTILCLENLLVCIKGALGLLMSQFTRTELEKLCERKNHLGAQPRIIGGDAYTGVFVNGFPNGFGLMEYRNGDWALGYWTVGMLDSFNERAEKYFDNLAGVFYRNNEGVYFFGLFNHDTAKEGRLFTASHKAGLPMSFDKVQDKVYHQLFWNKIIKAEENAPETQENIDHERMRYF